ncbi:ORF6N domain-containing protein [Chitinophaga oryzae]|uniref:ORF6N domain-containing protein n=1 Tax=Chitinophaga oryzae TaxID=2725414 RepID=A0AAE6ZEQ9_9BACT|nr:ORF6N domain-containing protein [Chitinophaga oryzae]QJB30700.1 ORF6N domain-containing protein [Chitinophaga oryzae]QJB37200.1 ORF6N domain-containing protein [Chitinophaga oryzae]
MNKLKQSQLVPEERIIKRIVQVRGEKVILDLHLAELYGVETRTLKQAVRRNIERFPEDFMFELTEEEIESVVSQNVIPHKKHFGGAKPFAFSETGVAMLSSVLRSDTAIEMNIAIMRTFVSLRKLSVNYQEVMRVLDEMRIQYDNQFEDIYRVLEHLIHKPEQPRNVIGFNLNREKKQ